MCLPFRRVTDKGFEMWEVVSRLDVLLQSIEQVFVQRLRRFSVFLDEWWF